MYLLVYYFGGKRFDRIVSSYDIAYSMGNKRFFMGFIDSYTIYEKTVDGMYLEVFSYEK